MIYISSMPHHEHKIKTLAPDAKGINKILKLDTNPPISFQIDSYTCTYKWLRTYLGLGQNVKFINRKKEVMANEQSAIGPKVKVVNAVTINEY